MNKSQRIRLSSGNTDTNKHIVVRLEQDIDTLEVMTLKLDTKEVYRDFNADYGVIIGRIIANDGIGIPNAKISIFIPLAEEDENNGDIVSIYPYKNPRDQNNEGKRYNLLPRVAKEDPETGVISPKQPFGSYPIKEEIVTNPTYLEVYKKYYKYSTVSNSSGDYMIYGVPTGTQTVHMSCDITDIGPYSMSPLTMVTNLGYSPNLFSADGTKIKPATDLDDLPNIETQEISVNVVPFWGDTTNFEIGITRQDFRIRATLVNTFVIFGTAFSDGANSMWTENFDNGEKFREYYRMRNDGEKNFSINSKRIGNITEKIYYIPNNISDNDIEYGNFNPEDMEILDPNEYEVFKNNGDFVYVIRANRNKYITDETGEKVLVDDTYKGGIYENFNGFITFEITDEDLGYSFLRQFIGQKAGDKFYAYPFRLKYKCPQTSYDAQSFNDTEDNKTQAWRNETFCFEAGKIYSIAKFHGLVFNDSNYENFVFRADGSQFGTTDALNDLDRDPNWNVGIIGVDTDFDEDNDVHQFPSNGRTDNNAEAFGANWLNLCLHFNQFGWFDEPDDWEYFGGLGSNTSYTSEAKKTHFYFDNEQLIAADDVNTKWFARSDLHHTDFIEVSKDVILDISEETADTKGFTLDILSPTLKTKIQNADFRNGQHRCPYNGGKLDGDPTKEIDTNYYFYKGFGDSDCIKFLISLGFV